MIPVRDAVIVARREFTERVRTRAFQISIATTLAIVAAVAILAGVLGEDGPTDYTVGAQGPEATAIAAAARTAAPQFDARVEVRRFTSPAEARAAVRDERVDAAITAGLMVTRDDASEELEQLLQSAARQVRAGEALRSEGLSGGAARRALNPPPLRTRSLEGEGDSGDEGVAFTASLLLYLQLIIYGLAVPPEWLKRSPRGSSRCCSPRSRREGCLPARSPASDCSDCCSCCSPRWWAWDWPRRAAPSS
jgi:ABC-2 type transport system permease protein